MSLELSNRSPLHMDQWDGSAAERREILSDVGNRGTLRRFEVATGSTEIGRP